MKKSESVNLSQRGRLPTPAENQAESTSLKPRAATVNKARRETPQAPCLEGDESLLTFSWSISDGWLEEKMRRITARLSVSRRFACARKGRRVGDHLHMVPEEFERQIQTVIFASDF